MGAATIIGVIDDVVALGVLDTAIKITDKVIK